MQRKTILLFVYGLITLLSALIGCQGAKGVRREPPSWEGLQGCLETALAAQTPEAKQRCVYLLEAFLDRRAGNPQAEAVAFRLGQLYLETGDASAAYDIFKGFPKEYPKSRRQEKAKLYLGVSLYFLDNPTDSLGVLHALAEDPKAVPWEREIFRYIAENYVKLERLSSALTWYARCHALAELDEDRERLEDRVLDVLSIGWEPEALKAATDLFQEGFFAEAIGLGVAATCIQRGEPGLAEDQLLRMSAEHEDDVFTRHIHALLARVSAEGGPRVCTVGCLLPLTGKYGRFGSSVLNAMLLGARGFQSPEEKGASVRLLIRDTQGDPEVGVQQLRELAEDPSVMGVVGPLRAKVAFACAEEAQELQIPMITLTQREEVARVGDYVFQNGLTIRQQVDTLVEFVMDEMALTSFAVLYPKDAYGTLSRELFESKVLEMGGEVVSAVPYEEGETDFQDEIRLLVGQEFLREMERREKQRKQEKGLEEGLEAGLEGGGGEYPEGSMEEEEPLMPPFQALFIPDHYRNVSLIAPHLAFYEVNEITLLGTNAWNSTQLVELAGEYVRDAIFVDGFFLESNMDYVREFVEKYMRAFQTEPRVLEAEGYDSLLMLEHSFLNAPVKTRDQVREVLAGMEGYPGLSGYTRFNEDGSAKKRLYILSIVGNDIRQIY